jgi:UDP-N-acetylmuramate--alanine ligase
VTAVPPAATDPVGPPSEDPVVPSAELDRVHLVGIGGAGMSGLARVLLARGAVVSGCDAREGRVITALKALGAEIFLGHDAAHVHPEDTVVISSAIRTDNPELVVAGERGQPVLHRGAVLAALMRGRRSIVVAGTHGKTTTTSMMTRALQHAGLDPSFAIGGDLNEPGSNAHEGSGDVFVAEADESDGSFLLLSPTLAVVTNVEADHLDHYLDTQQVHDAFENFVGRIEPGGTLVVCVDDPGAAALVPIARAAGLTVLGYGESAKADVRIGSVELPDGGGSSFTVQTADGAPTPVDLRVPGRHNVLNATAVVAAGQAFGVAPATIAEGLALFPGARRRFELKGMAGGVRVYDDYAHHPTEVEATLRAARQISGRGRLIAVFQPHRYTRTEAFAEGFGEALALADEVIVMDVYAASEEPRPGVTGALVAEAVPLPAEVVRFAPSWTDVPAQVAALAKPGDVVMTLGAGDITQLGPMLITELTR